MDVEDMSSTETKDQLKSAKTLLRVNMFITFVVILNLGTNMYRLSKGGGSMYLILTIVMFGLAFVLFRSYRSVSSRRKNLIKAV